MDTNVCISQDAAGTGKVPFPLSQPPQLAHLLQNLSLSCWFRAQMDSCQSWGKGRPSWWQLSVRSWNFTPAMQAEMLDAESKGMVQERSWWRWGYPAFSLNAVFFPQARLLQSNTRVPENSQSLANWHDDLSHPAPSVPSTTMLNRAEAMGKDPTDGGPFALLHPFSPFSISNLMFKNLLWVLSCCKPASM